MGYLPSARSRWLDIGQVLFCVLMDRDGVQVHKHARKERGQYPAISTEQAWSIKDLVYGFSWKVEAGSPERARWLHLTSSGSQSERRIWFILSARGAGHIINVVMSINFAVIRIVSYKPLQRNWTYRSMRTVWFVGFSAFSRGWRGCMISLRICDWFVVLFTSVVMRFDGHSRRNGL